MYIYSIISNNEQHNQPTTTVFVLAWKLYLEVGGRQSLIFIMRTCDGLFPPFWVFCCRILYDSCRIQYSHGCFMATFGWWWIRGQTHSNPSLVTQHGLSQVSITHSSSDFPILDTIFLIFLDIFSPHGDVPRFEEPQLPWVFQWRDAHRDHRVAALRWVETRSTTSRALWLQCRL